MTNLFSLLASGYFAEELPPPFTTVDYARLINNNIGNLPNTFTSGRLVAKISPHSIARVDIFRRSIGIPNPILFFNLCREIAINWQNLSNLVLRSRISASIPKVDQNHNRALIPFLDFPDLNPIKAQIRSASKWILTTDIAKFYPSIYTHIIPWAMHGKPYSKTHTNVKILGNSLDRWIRNGQDRQTIGIPIGPDTSLLISELILCQVDLELSARIPNIQAMRYVDDYEFGFKTYAEAEKALAILQEILNEYELDINFEKTKIIKLPAPINSSWTSELRQFNIRNTSLKQRNDLIHYFSRAFELSNQNPSDNVLKYTVRRLRDVIISSPENWDLLQNLLFQCAMVEASTLQPSLEILIDYNTNKFPINLRKLEVVLNSIIEAGCPIGYTNETAWAIWGLIFWGLIIKPEAADVISKSSDVVIALLALDALNKKLIPSNLNLALWQSYMTTDDLYGRQWLLAYEANIKNWLPSLNVPDHVVADSNFGFLKVNDVFFYDPKRFKSAAIRPIPYEYVFI